MYYFGGILLKFNSIYKKKLKKLCFVIIEMETQGKLNQFGDYEDTTNMSVNDWEDRWNKSQTQFHVNRTHP